MFSCELKILIVVELQVGEKMRWKEIKWLLTDWRTWLNQQLKSMRWRLPAPSKNQCEKKDCWPRLLYICICTKTTQNSFYPVFALSQINKDRPTVVTSNLKSQMINTIKVYFSLTQRPIWIFLSWQFSWVALFQAMSQGFRLLSPCSTSNFNPGSVKAEEDIGKAH